MKAKHSFGVPADFEWKIHDGVLVIVDLNEGGKSVTNDAESVLRTISDILVGKGLSLPQTIIYRDSDGIYDGLRYPAPQGVEFYVLGETNVLKAIEKALKS